MFSACGISTGGPVGQAAWTTPGTYSWICPPEVFEVGAVAVGGGADSVFNSEKGGGGGGTGWKNSIPTIPGQAYTVKVGGVGVGQDSYFISLATVKGGGANSAHGGTFVGDGGGNGGEADIGGGGAGGYTGPGGNGGRYFSNDTTAVVTSTPATSGQGGGGGGGGSDFSHHIDGSTTNEYGGGKNGGGVGILGQGSNGTAGANYINGALPPTAGGDGSGAPAFGAGAGGAYFVKNTTTGDTVSGDGNLGFPGAVRLIWGAGRAFPSTLTGDM